MMEPVNIDPGQAKQRAYRYWYEDGLVFIASGCLFIPIGPVLLAQGLLPVESPWSALAGLAFPVVSIAGVFVAGRWVNARKNRITYPRTGYVRYHRTAGSRRWLAAAVAVVMGTLVTTFFGTAPDSLVWLPLFQGLGVGAMFFYLGYSLAFLPFSILSAVSMVIGLAIALSDLAVPLRSGAYFGSMGIAQLAVGGVILRRYLRQT